MEQLSTVSGKPITLTASTRLELPVYRYLAKQAEAEGISLAAKLYQIISKEVQGKLPPAGTGSAAGG